MTKQHKERSSVLEKGVMVDLKRFFVHGIDHARRAEDESDSVGTCKDTSLRQNTASSSTSYLSTYSK